MLLNTRELEIQRLLEGGREGVAIVSYKSGTLEFYSNNMGSGPMIHDNYVQWRSWMTSKDHKLRDRARRHKVSWNIRAVCAISLLPEGDVNDVWKESQAICKEEWLNEHGYRHFLGEMLPISIWINDILGAIGAIVGSWGYILTAIAAVLDPIMRAQEKQWEYHEEKTDEEDRALRTLSNYGIMPPLREDGSINRNIIILYTDAALFNRERGLLINPADPEATIAAMNDYKANMTTPTQPSDDTVMGSPTAGNIIDAPNVANNVPLVNHNNSFVLVGVICLIILILS